MEIVSSAGRRLPIIDMLLPDVWMGGYVCINLSIFLCFVASFRPRFHGDDLASSVTAASERSVMHTLVSTHKHIEQGGRQTHKKHSITQREQENMFLSRSVRD